MTTAEQVADRFALTADLRQELFGRLTELDAEREVILSQLRGRGGCGTDRGYYRHRKVSEPPCRECCAAHAAVERRRLRRRKPRE